MARVFVEEWGAGYGSPYLVVPDQDHEEAELVEDGPLFETHMGGASEAPSIAFVDGVRRAEAWLFAEDAETGTSGRGIAGAHGCGAAIVANGKRATFADATVRRVVIWGSGLSEPLPRIPGGWSWTVGSIADTSPDAPLQELQKRMRQEEGRLAEQLASSGVLVVVDGPLNFVRSRDLPVAGYVKTHHRALLEPEFHRRIPSLPTGHRTSLFRLGDDRYSCYLRIAGQGHNGNPWSGIVRLEFPQSAGMSEVVRVATSLSTELPRFAGVPHRDPRAPQNLQPVGALETHLRHLLGHPGLSMRAVREAVATGAQPAAKPGPGEVI